jgi:hypothetical protein
MDNQRETRVERFKITKIFTEEVKKVMDYRDDPKISKLAIWNDIADTLTTKDANPGAECFREIDPKIPTA